MQVQSPNTQRSTMEPAMEQASSHNTSAISEYHTGQSSNSSATDSRMPASSSSSVCYSTRIKRMMENRGNFSNELEFEIESSKVHWSELSYPITDNGSHRLTDCEYFEVLKNHPQWRGFFKDIKVELGKKINEGGQAEIYDAKVKFGDGDGYEFDYGSHVVKLMKGDCPLQDFQRQWPVGMLSNVSKAEGKGPLMWIKGGTLIDNQFGFVMVRQWGDLRKLIDIRTVEVMKEAVVMKKVGFFKKVGITINKALHFKKLNNNQGSPFKNLEFIFKVIVSIAIDMEKLHTEYGIVHRDLKASNVLLWSLGEELPDNNPDVKAHVVDYECSVGVVGTGFWRAPEILQQLKDGIPSSELRFTKKADVYSYAMTCYEILTGRLPFEDHPCQDYDFVLKGNRPKLPEPLVGNDDFLARHPYRHKYSQITKMIVQCWHHDPLKRPTFQKIVRTLGKINYAKAGNMIYIDDLYKSNLDREEEF